MWNQKINTLKSVKSKCLSSCEFIWLRNLIKYYEGCPLVSRGLCVCVISTIRHIVDITFLDRKWIRLGCNLYNVLVGNPGDNCWQRKDFTHHVSHTRCILYFVSPRARPHVLLLLLEKVLRRLCSTAQNKHIASVAMDRWIGQDMQCHMQRSYTSQKKNLPWNFEIFQTCRTTPYLLRWNAIHSNSRCNLRLLVL